MASPWLGGKGQRRGLVSQMFAGHGQKLSVGRQHFCSSRIAISTKSSSNLPHCLGILRATSPYKGTATAWVVFPARTLSPHAWQRSRVNPGKRARRMRRSSPAHRLMRTPWDNLVAITGLGVGLEVCGEGGVVRMDGESWLGWRSARGA